LDKQNLLMLLEQLIAQWESEVVEFKRGGEGFSTHDIGKYFSALANEANLRGSDKAWLVFGADDKTRQIVGTNFRLEADRLNSLKLQISEGTSPNVTLNNIHDITTEYGRVLMFEIPAAPQAIPIAWKGHYYARAGENLIAMSLLKLEAIRRQLGVADWSAQQVPDASLGDLDHSAVIKAKGAFALKNTTAAFAKEVLAWTDAVFLDRAGLTQNGQITRTTLLLLGKSESAYKLSPHPAQLVWKLEGLEQAYAHFGPPFFLNTTALFQKIRNIPLRILPSNQLVHVEVTKYDQKIVLEALHNCIAHQDYNRNGRVIVTEQLDRLTFANEGNFFEGLPSEYVGGDKTAMRYRNPFLTKAMVALNMIDTMGYGIHQMHVMQRNRYFPMPDFDLTEPTAVRLTIHGAIVDPAYSSLLILRTDLLLADILALDRVQKKLPLSDDVIKRLRRAKLIEGRKPHVHISAGVAEATANKADYIRTRSQDDVFYAKLVLDYLAQYGSAPRQEVDKLLWSKLSDVLVDDQKRTKISNLLSNMRRVGSIKNVGNRKLPRWTLNK
jgi:ATP-dependent DNA helicase RecG